MLNIFSDEITIKTIYLVCSSIGGAVLSLQLIMLILGGGGGEDSFDGDHGDHSDGFGLISIRSIASFLTFFGLSGWWGLEKGWGAGYSTVLGLGTGSAMMLLVAWMISLQSKLNEEGNINPDNAVGTTATVYLRIPPQGEGRGKITVSIQGRTHEYQAVSKGSEMLTGTEVRVLRRVTENTFEVEALA